MVKMTKDNNLMSGKGEWNESEHPRDAEGKFTTGSGASNDTETQSTDKSEKQTKATAKEKLATDVDKVLNDTYKDRHLTLRENTPLVLQNLGVPDLPMLITTKHAYLVINKEGKYTGENDNYHDLGKEMFLQIPDLLEKPVLVFEDKKQANTITVIVDAHDKQGNQIMIPIKINGRGNKEYIEIDANIVKTSFGKKNLQNYLSNNVDESNLLYAENAKVRNLNLV